MPDQQVWREWAWLKTQNPGELRQLDVTRPLHRKGRQYPAAQKPPEIERLDNSWQQ